MASFFFLIVCGGGGGGGGTNDHLVYTYKKIMKKKNDHPFYVLLKSLNLDISQNIGIIRILEKKKGIIKDSMAMSFVVHFLNTDYVCACVL